MSDTAPWVPDDTFAARLALVRNRMGWNVLEAATACEVSDQSWHNWESGGSKPRAMDEVIGRIAKATGCDPVWLMFGTEQAAS